MSLFLRKLNDGCRRQITGGIIIHFECTHIPCDDVEWIDGCAVPVREFIIGVSMHGFMTIQNPRSMRTRAMITSVMRLGKAGLSKRRSCVTALTQPSDVVPTGSNCRCACHGLVSCMYVGGPFGRIRISRPRGFTNNFST